MTFHARELQSYKQLPQLWYHFSHEGARRAAAARRAVARARVHHEGLVLVRPRRGGAGQELRRAQGCVRAHLGALRARGVLRRGRVRNHGRPRVVGLHGAGGIRREHPRPLRERRLLRRLRRRARDSACAGRSPSRWSEPEEVETPGVDDDRALGGVPRHRPGGDVESDAGDGRRAPCPGAHPRRRPPERGEARHGARRGVPARRRTRRSGRSFGAGGGSLGPVGVDVDVDRRRGAA